MTVALCTVCGSLKFGAYLGCEECGVTNALPHSVSPYFTDHYWSEITLASLGRVVRHINAQHRSPKIRTFAFLQFVSDANPDAMQIRPDIITRWRVRGFLRCASLPTVVWEESEIFRHRQASRTNDREFT